MFVILAVVCNLREVELCVEYVRIFVFPEKSQINFLMCYILILSGLY